MNNQINQLPWAIALLWLAGTSAGIADGSGKVTVVPLQSDGQVVSAKIDSNGTIHLLSNSAEGPRYAKSTDNGKSFGKPMAIVDTASRKPGLEFQPWDLAVGQGNSVHVAMSTNAWKLKLPKDEWAFFYARLDPNAEAFSPVQNVNQKPSEGFSLAANAKGDVTACWLSGKLYANISRDNGKTFAPAVEIDPKFDPCDCCTTSAAYASDGRLAVFYREETNNERDMYLALWDQYHNKVTRTRVSATPWKVDACPMTYYAILPRNDGFVAVWPTKKHIYFAQLDNKGTPRSPTEIRTAGMTGMRTGMLALSDSAGNTLVAWKHDNQLGWQLYDKLGKPTGSPGSTNSPGVGAAGVVGKDGQFILFP